jgi:hypothetical protein
VVLVTRPVRARIRKIRTSAALTLGQVWCVKRTYQRRTTVAMTARSAVSVIGPTTWSATLPAMKLPAQIRLMRKRRP